MASSNRKLAITETIYLNKKRKLKLKIRHPRIHVGLLSKIKMVWRGKKDGKKGLATNSNSKTLSPTVLEEQERIAALIGEVYVQLTRKNQNRFIEMETAYTAFSFYVEQLNALKSILKGKPHEWEESKYVFATDESLVAEDEKIMNSILNAKRKSEEKAERIGIRIRRFREYQKSLETLRNQDKLFRAEVERYYLVYCDNYSIIQFMISYLRRLYQKYNKRVNMRLAWYWHGYLKKCSPNQYTLEMPKIEMEQFNILFDKEIAELTNAYKKIYGVHEALLGLSSEGENENGTLSS